MTLLGKIFTMLIFIGALMCAFFAVSVFMADKNWKDVVMNEKAGDGKNLGLLEVLKQKKIEIDTLKKELDTLRGQYHHEKATWASAMGAAEQAYQAEAKKREVAVATYNSLLQAHGQAVAEVAATQQRLKDVTAEIAEARAAIKLAQQDRDQKLEAVSVLTVELNEMEDLKRRLEEDISRNVGQIARMENVLKANGLNENDDVDGIPPPIDGLVTAVKKKFMEVSIGSDDGLKVGHQLDVFQGRTYKGRVVIRQTKPDVSVAEIIPEYLKGDIQKGDRVRTRTKVS